MPCKAAAREQFPGPPVRWRSAHSRVELGANTKTIQFQSTLPGRTVRAAAVQSLVVSALSRRQQNASHVQAVLVVGRARCSAPLAVPQRQSPCRGAGAGDMPAQVASARSGCQNAPCTRRRHLTTPSSGRAKGRFAPFGPPLMSNVRPICSICMVERVVILCLNKRRRYLTSATYHSSS